MLNCIVFVNTTITKHYHIKAKLHIKRYRRSNTMDDSLLAILYSSSELERENITKKLRPKYLEIMNTKCDRMDKKEKWEKYIFGERNILCDIENIFVNGSIVVNSDLDATHQSFSFDCENYGGFIGTMGDWYIDKCPPGRYNLHKCVSRNHIYFGITIINDAKGNKIPKLFIWDPASLNGTELLINYTPKNGDCSNKYRILGKMSQFRYAKNINCDFFDIELGKSFTLFLGGSVSLGGAQITITITNIVN